MKGYITKAKFHEYGLHFVGYLRRNGLFNKPHMLIYDSHSGHLYNLTFYQLMKKNIHVFTTPPHQPSSTATGQNPICSVQILWERNLTRYNNEHREDL